MEPKFVCLDVGGTQIKAASIDKDGHLSEPIQYFPARSGENAETILDHFIRIIRQVSEPDAIPALRLAFPGPFDYERGICLMRGLGKYDALYGLDFGGELGRRLEIPRDTIRFANDAAAFALGELHFGAGKGAQRAMFVLYWNRLRQRLCGKWSIGIRTGTRGSGKRMDLSYAFPGRTNR